MLYVQEKGNPLHSSMFFLVPIIDGLPPMLLGASKHGSAKRVTLLLYGKVQKNMKLVSIHNTC
jgi:hypothetical protein